VGLWLRHGGARAQQCPVRHARGRHLSLHPTRLGRYVPTTPTAAVCWAFPCGPRHGKRRSRAREGRGRSADQATQRPDNRRRQALGATSCCYCRPTQQGTPAKSGFRRFCAQAAVCEAQAESGRRVFRQRTGGCTVRSVPLCASACNTHQLAWSSRQASDAVDCLLIENTDFQSWLSRSARFASRRREVTPTCVYSSSHKKNSLFLAGCQSTLTRKLWVPNPFLFELRLLIMFVEPSVCCGSTARHVCDR